MTKFVYLTSPEKSEDENNFLIFSEVNENQFMRF